jgi:hypothetical protein
LCASADHVWLQYMDNMPLNTSVLNCFQVNSLTRLF